MTQKANLFKGQQKKKSIPPNRHGKVAYTRKGKRVVKPSKVTKDMETDKLVDEKKKCFCWIKTLILC
ncbi:Unknown protein [Striga hermonthica]|uniref:Uncharacterized protein n=1 Tax=Striga hermonthica TaxID=68872 RepID=A0A9N7NCN2_STRHE|nr:Unknown protein [Striga hermonthica]